MSPSHRGRFVAYHRVSTERQGKSGLGLDAQRKAILDYLNGGAWELSAEFVEVESGKHSDRPQLVAALEACRKQKAKLVIAKLDRLSRNLAFIATLMESGVEFVAVDNPHANKLTVHILAAVAQHEREMISERTKAALQAAKARKETWQPEDQTSGQARGRGSKGERGPIRRQCAAHHPGNSEEWCDKCQRHRKQAKRRGVKTARGGIWTHVQVGKALARA